MPQGTGVPVGKQALLTVSNVALALTLPTVVPQIEWARVTVETQSVRYWLDGSTPDATNGHLAPAGTIIELQGNDQVRKFRVIRATGADGVIQATFGWN